MTKEDLLKEVLVGSKVEEIHPLHYAIIEECCENAVNNSGGSNDKKLLQFAVDIAFLSSSRVLKATLLTALQDKDAVNISFNGQVYTINRNSTLIN